MFSWIKKHIRLLPLLCLGACAGMGRSCSSCSAENFGADWVIVQVDVSGRPFRCWMLRNGAITNEPQSDGIFWKDPNNGNLVHISGFYNRVQVENGNWDAAFRSVGLTKTGCEKIENTIYDP